LILFPNLSSMSNMQLVLLASFINPLVFEATPTHRPAWPCSTLLSFASRNTHHPRCPPTPLARCTHPPARASPSSVEQFSLICARLVTRSINEHDEACSGIPPCVAMVFKKCFGRYIIYLITDFWLALLTSIILGVWEIFAAANVAVRDRCTAPH
jgi:hypothetical protein